jgi:hypothetical protein
MAPAILSHNLLSTLHCRELAMHTWTYQWKQRAYEHCFFSAEEDGIRSYASCLSFMDEVPAYQIARNPQLIDCVATKAICLLSRQPCLQFMEQVVLHSRRVNVLSSRTCFPFFRIWCPSYVLYAAIQLVRSRWLATLVSPVYIAGPSCQCEHVSLFWSLICHHFFFQVLEALHHVMFVTGPGVSLPDLLAKVLHLSPLSVVSTISNVILTDHQTSHFFMGIGVTCQNFACTSSLEFIPCQQYFIQNTIPSRPMY